MFKKLLIGLLVSNMAMVNAAELEASSTFVSKMESQLSNFSSNWVQRSAGNYDMDRNSSNAFAMKKFGRITSGYEDSELIGLTTQTEYSEGHGFQCVGFVKAATGYSGLSSAWTKGTQVTPSNLPQRGDIIATFNTGNKFSPSGGDHVAIYWGGDSNKIVVVDQNYYWHERISYHEISFSGSDNSDADNYYVVEF